MSVRPKTRYTLEEYLALERAEQTRHEFLDGELAIASLDCVLSICDVYEGVENLAPPAGAQ